MPSFVLLAYIICISLFLLIFTACVWKIVFCLWDTRQHRCLGIGHAAHTNLVFIFIKNKYLNGAQSLLSKKLRICSLFCKAIYFFVSLGAKHSYICKKISAPKYYPLKIAAELCCHTILLSYTHYFTRKCFYCSKIGSRVATSTHKCIPLLMWSKMPFGACRLRFFSFLPLQ